MTVKELILKLADLCPDHQDESVGVYTDDGISMSLWVVYDKETETPLISTCEILS